MSANSNNDKPAPKLGAASRQDDGGSAGRRTPETDRSVTLPASRRHHHNMPNAGNQQQRPLDANVRSLAVVDGANGNEIPNVTAGTCTVSTITPSSTTNRLHNVISRSHHANSNAEDHRVTQYTLRGNRRRRSPYRVARDPSPDRVEAVFEDDAMGPSSYRLSTEKHSLVVVECIWRKFLAEKVPA